MVYFIIGSKQKTDVQPIDQTEAQKYQGKEYIKQRMWMARCVHLCVSVNEDYPKRRCKQ